MRKPSPPAQSGGVTVTVDGWSCAAGSVPIVDSAGNTWVLQTLDGWFGGVDVRSAPVDRPMTDGVYDGPTTRGARTVTVDGTLIASTVSALLTGMDRVAAVLSGSTRTGRLVIIEPMRSFTRSAAVRLGGPTGVTRSARLTAEFSLSLYCPDPNRYGPDQVTVLDVDPVDLVNTGDGTSYPIITFTGPAVNPIITVNGGDSIQLMMTLVADDEVVVDCGNRTVMAGVESKRHYLSAASRWISIKPGSNVFTGAGTIAWNQAWS